MFMLSLQHKHYWNKKEEEKKEVKGHQRGLTKGRKGDLKPILNMKN
jgi:hypothetical protein